MAKIILGPIVQSVRGSIGGVTFRKVGAKYYANPKSAGPVSPGIHSGAHHAILKTITTSWLELDAPIRQFWERYHALATPRNPRTGQTLPTPYSLYLCYQSMRMHCGVAMLTASVPDPPIFSYGTLSWFGPYCIGDDPVEGYVQMYWQEELQVDKICVFCAATKNGVTPNRFPRKIFPTAEYTSGRAVVNLAYLIYGRMGYPPGLTGLVTQDPPILQKYLVSGWGIYNDLIFSTPWTPQDSITWRFRYPPAAPIIYG
jgi:hypothetical protein